MKQININKSISRKTNILSILPCIFNSFQNTDYSFLCIAFNQDSEITSLTSFQNQNEYKLIGNIIDLCDVESTKSIVLIEKKFCINQDTDKSTKLATNLGDALDKMRTSLIDFIITDDNKEFFSLRYHDLLCGKFSEE